MKLKDGMLLYHGSYTSVENVDLNKCEAGKDFVGKIANDTTNPVITTYLTGLYGSIADERSAQIAISLLLPDRLKEQYCFISQRAVSCLKVVEVCKYEL